MANGESSTQGRLMWWLISLLTGGLVGVAGHTITGNTEHASRLAVLEHQATETKDELRSISHKIDRLMERKP